MRLMRSICCFFFNRCASDTGEEKKAERLRFLAPRAGEM
jgi:hypothetical protein